ncbi:aminotransferase class IV [Alienimonas californiensis]|uniref:branched-chain-amino-acid transaminase n=1 Tax=Alienimonas californiensis TaxID=2527989 RepID=A0A517P5S2_9PLAN|nr:aminotransferase class IV [Alienimonas californiensis]QDT14705.1 D-alanine aminotransferase [Alienimonas californiensis]
MPPAVPIDEPLAYLGGRLLPAAEAALPLDDGLVTGGAAVTERLRTFGGVPFAVDRHLDRLERSAAAAFIDLPGPREELAEAIAAVVRHNFALLERTGGPGDELSVGLFVSAGSPGGPSVAGVTTTVLEAGRFAADYQDGVRLVVPATRQIPAACLDPHIKTRSRLHWRIAARQAAAIDPGTRPLLLHLDGTVAETDTGNVLSVRGRTIRTPPRAGTLEGVTQAVTREVATDLGFQWEERPLTVADLCAGDEALVASTTPTLWPVVRIDGRPVGAGTVGSVYRTLTTAWERLVESAGLNKPTSF